MNPVVIIVLILVALLGLYFLMTELGAAQLATGTFPSGTVTVFSSIAFKILMAVVIFYGIYYIVEVIKTSVQARKEKARKL